MSAIAGATSVLVAASGGGTPPPTGYTPPAQTNVITDLQPNSYQSQSNVVTDLGSIS